MAGKVLRKKVLKQLDAEGGPEVFFDRIANGETITSLSPEYGCSRNYLARTIDSQPEYAKMLAKARQASADALVEGGFEMVEKLGATSSSTEIAAVREKLNWRKFMASSFNQDRYSTKPQTNIQLSVGELHLDSIRKFTKDLKTVGEAAHISLEAEDD